RQGRARHGRRSSHLDSVDPRPRLVRIVVGGETGKYGWQFGGIDRRAQPPEVRGVHPAVLLDRRDLDVCEPARPHLEVGGVGHVELLDRAVRGAEEVEHDLPLGDETSPLDVRLAGLLPELPSGRLLGGFTRFDGSPGSEPPRAVPRPVRVAPAEEQGPGAGADEDHTGGGSTGTPGRGRAAARGEAAARRGGGARSWGPVRPRTASRAALPPPPPRGARPTRRAAAHRPQRLPPRPPTLPMS